MSIEKNIKKYSKVSSIVLLSASILILKAPPSIAMMDDDEDAKISSSALFKKDKNIDCSSSGDVNHRVSFSLNNLPNEVLYAIMNFLDIHSLGYLSQINHHFYQITSENYFWTNRLNKDKIILSLGKAWENSPTHILSYKPYYAVIHILQNMPKDGEEKVEKLLNLAILPDSTFGQKYLCLFYRMLGQKGKVSRCFYRAAELGDDLSQEIIVDAFYKGLESAEEKYQNLLFLAEKGWKYAQDQVVEALSSPVGALYSFGWNETHNEWRYQELISLAKRGWGGRKGWGSGTIRRPDPFFRVVNTLYEGELGCDKRPGEERYQELLFLAEEGWESAQEKVVQALVYGKLAQDALPEEERYQKLLIYAEKGWYDAQKIISEALARGWLGHDKRSEVERYQKLTSFAEKGWKSAQDLVGSHVFRFRALGWKERSQEEWWQELIFYAEKGWNSAQYEVAEVLRIGSNGWSKKPVEERYQAYVSCAEKGWGSARTDIARMLYQRSFGWEKIPEEKLYQKLSFLAEKGWGDTRYVVYSLYEGKFGCGKMSVEERYNHILSLAEKGDSNGQSWVISAISRGELGWEKISEEERYHKLVSLGEIGWEAAQAQIVDALYRGNLDQDQRSEKERYEELIILAEKNWISAQHVVEDTHKYNMLGVEYAFCWGAPSYDYYGRDLRQRKSRDIPPPYFQKYKNVNYFRLLRALVTSTITNEGFRLLLEEKTTNGTPTILDTKFFTYDLLK